MDAAGMPIISIPSGFILVAVCPTLQNNLTTTNQINQFLRLRNLTNSIRNTRHNYCNIADEPTTWFKRQKKAPSMFAWLSLLLYKSCLPNAVSIVQTCSYMFGTIQFYNLTIEHRYAHTANCRTSVEKYDTAHNIVSPVSMQGECWSESPPRADCNMKPSLSSADHNALSQQTKHCYFVALHCAVYASLFFIVSFNFFGKVDSSWTVQVERCLSKLWFNTALDWLPI